LINTSKEFYTNRITKINDIILDKYDVLYIDGAHDYENVKLDIELWKDKAKYFICGHDYCDKFPGVVKAVNEILGEPDKIFKDTSWLIEVKK
jgi:hypothetical protein